MQTNSSYIDKPLMTVDFDILQRARSEKGIAMLLRSQWHLDKSQTGKVFCDEAECRERLNNGFLPPVLTPAQFAKISQGLPYGADDDDPDLGMTIQASSSYAGAGADPYVAHPLYPEYAALSAPVKDALRNDFRSFLFLKERGRLDAIVSAVHEQLARDATRAAAAERKRVQEKAIADAVNTPEYQQLIARRNAKRSQHSRG